jgi:hypothetical protein
MPPRSECFVYIQLPGTLQPVVCGRFERTRTRDGGAVGRFMRQPVAIVAGLGLTGITRLPSGERTGLHAAVVEPGRPAW